MPTTFRDGSVILAFGNLPAGNLFASLVPESKAYEQARSQPQPGKT